MTVASLVLNRIADAAGQSKRHLVHFGADADVRQRRPRATRSVSLASKPCALAAAAKSGAECSCAAIAAARWRLNLGRLDADQIARAPDP